MRSWTRKIKRKKRERRGSPFPTGPARQEEFHALRSGRLYPRDYLQLIRPCCLLPRSVLKMEKERESRRRSEYLALCVSSTATLRRRSRRHCSREKPIAGNTSLRGDRKEERRTVRTMVTTSTLPLCARQLASYSWESEREGEREESSITLDFVLSTGRRSFGLRGSCSLKRFHGTSCREVVGGELVWQRDSNCACSWTSNRGGTWLMNASGVILSYKFCTRSFLRQLKTIIDFISNGNQCVHSKFR